MNNGPDSLLRRLALLTYGGLDYLITNEGAASLSPFILANQLPLTQDMSFHSLQQLTFAGTGL